MILRDVINTKSSFKKRHSVDANNLKEISKYYAIESRIYNSVKDENGKDQKGPLWFMNYLIFDFDFDEEHYTLKEGETFESVLNKNLNKLYSLLGTPRYIIKNKDFKNDLKLGKISEKEYRFIINEYFTDFSNADKPIVKLPKKYGCQVVYELKESIKSQYPEQYKFFNNFRRIINDFCSADQMFKNHVFKNFYNNKLFNIVENTNFNLIDIYEIAKTNDKIFNEIIKNKYYASLDKNIIGDNFKNLIDNIKNCDQFKSLNSDNRDPLDIIFENYSNKLSNFYMNLNTYKTENENKDIKSFKSSSRNESLFNYFKSIDINSIFSSENSYENLVLNNCKSIFDFCDIKDPIDQYEFENTRDSVLFYRKNNLLSEPLISIPDNKFNVFKFNYINRTENCIIKFNNFILKDNEKIIKLLLNSNKYKKCLIKFENRNKNEVFKCNLYNTSSLQANLILADYIIIKGYDIALSNVKNIFNKDFISFVKKILNLCDNSKEYGLYDIFNIIKEALYYVHFKIYYTIKDKANRILNARKSSCRRCQTNCKRLNRLINNVNYLTLGDLNKNNELFNILLSKGLINDKNNFKSKPISFYQSYFKISNMKATLFSRFIKNLIANRQLNEVNNNFYNYFNNFTFINYITSDYIDNIINNFIIYIFNLYYYLFYIKDNIYI